jgi:hypothetical protein
MDRYAYFLALYEADIDHGNFALQMLTTCDNNSYCHMLMQGATATMEAWTRQEKDNLSWSHPWASAPGTVGLHIWSHPWASAPGTVGLHFRGCVAEYVPCSMPKVFGTRALI